MKIKLYMYTGAPEKEIEIAAGSTIEEIIWEYRDELKYIPAAAVIDHEVKHLCKRIDKECTIRILDIHSNVGSRIYQNSVALLFLKAVYDVLHKDAIIKNSLSKGIFTSIAGKGKISDQEVKAIEDRMHELVLQDLPIERDVVTVEDARQRFRKWGEYEKEAILCEGVENVKFYDLGGYQNFFYGLMVPRTGYLKEFALKRYRSGIILRLPYVADPVTIAPYEEQPKLYEAFAEATEWGKILKIDYVSDLNKMIDEGKMKEIVQISEALHEKRIAEIADMIKNSKKRIILIAGPSSSGKTTFARRLCIQLRVNGLDPLYLGTDDYFLERVDSPRDENGEYDYEGLDAIDIELFNNNMNDLLAGKDVDLPSYDFITGKKGFGKNIISIRQDQPIVIEGIHALNDALTPYVPSDEKFKIYISPLTQLNIDRHNRIPTTDARMLRRMVRDYQYRNRNAQVTIKDWTKVRRGEDKNIFPFIDTADAFFNSAHIYEIAVLKKYAEPLLKSISQEELEYIEAQRLLTFLKYFETADVSDIIVNNSIIREFIGGSVF